jgi:hypothetical protein
MAEPSFRFICAPSALAGAPSGWAREMLREGEVALLGDEGLEPVNAVAHELDLLAVSVVRAESSSQRQDATVIGYAAALPLVWVASSFTEHANAWARDRGPMTLLSQSSGPIGDKERRRIDRFVALLGRQSE